MRGNPKNVNDRVARNRKLEKGGKKVKRRKQKKKPDENIEIMQPKSPLLTTRSCGHKASQLPSSFADQDGRKVDGSSFNDYTGIYRENESSESDSCYSDCFSFTDTDGERSLSINAKFFTHLVYFFFVFG